MDWDIGFTMEANGRCRKADAILRSEGNVLLTDRVDMMAASERHRFFRRVSEKVGEKLEDVEAKGEGVWNRVFQEHQQSAATASAAPAEEPAAEDLDAQAARLLAEMPENIRAEAEAKLHAADLLKNVVDDVAVLGVAGERATVAALFLVGVSRLLKRPAAARVKGPTSSGKSYLIEQVARLFPGEAIIMATQMTAQALFHMEEGALRHRWVVGGERSRREDDDTAEATRALREMLSSGRLSKLMPVKVGGEIITQLIEQDGPIAYVESTTLDAVFAEDENRCISLYTDEQPQQTRLILNRLAADSAGATRSQQRDRILLVHHAMQRMLRRYEVVIPYATRLATNLPDKRVEARRAFPHLLSMIQASALLHQQQREQDDDGRLQANEQDYRIAVALLQDPMRRLLGGGLPASVTRFFLRLRGWFGNVATFTSRDAQAKEETSRSSVYGWLAELNRVGALEQVEEQRGRKPAVWKVAVGELTEVNAGVLPDFDDVFG
jgi:hypothetical protein